VSAAVDGSRELQRVLHFFAFVDHSGASEANRLDLRDSHARDLRHARWPGPRWMRRCSALPRAPSTLPLKLLVLAAVNPTKGQLHAPQRARGPLRPQRLNSAAPLAGIDALTDAACRRRRAATFSTRSSLPAVDL